MNAPARARGRFPLRLEQLRAAPAKPLAAAPGPQGIGLDSHGVRERLLQRLQAEGLRDARVLAAMRAVPRHAFVDTALAAQAYEDTSLPIGLGQTISKPSVVARMIELLIAPQPAGKPLRLLEIGTGCGYQAAVLAQIGRFVVSIERLKPLHDRARENLAASRTPALRLVYGDGRLGHAPNAPYDGVIAAAGGDDLPAAWLDQLAPGGRLVAPMLDARSGRQALVVVDRREDGSLARSEHEAVKFVPLKSGVD
ncbi:MAG TPA: protein-L-isoaspartate(D-aspartate) O-methyltransferase [Methylibium sp.]|uniref:protein-L-isoaspartate(D-aspartate) O-methyltransferase n=1 Tax=Methylibium sp. TaxID=2067992 RepID=UPI002DBEADC1|nr:protein-L-isoaspartate(D-aspartate) O-methyltransferase [Methylibium sp.]HEU4459066.1 protein-L-isoaspartate(D-aspartate) O-methyltransferase [Methylibium sp.]